MNSFKTPKSARRVANIKKQKAIAVKNKDTEELKNTVSDSSESESSSDDSDYEEILISSLTSSKDNKSDHVNHFQETEPDPVAKPTIAKPTVPIPKVKKSRESKSKKVVIKKYYQQREPVSTAPKTPIIKSQPEPRQSYIGIGSYGASNSKFNNKLSSRILNW